MDDKVTIDLDREIFDELTRRAEFHGHSVDEEVATIVRETVLPLHGETDWVARARKIREMTPLGSIPVSSTRLIRASRDFDH